MNPARAAGGLLLAALLGCSQGDPPSCKIDRVADLPLLAGRRIPTVQAALGPQPVVLYIDTGAGLSVVSEGTPEKFGLPERSSGQTTMITGIGGTVFARVVTIDRLNLGQGIARNIDMPVAGNLGPPVQGMPVLGAFGGDFLANYDVDIDLPGHHFAMYRLRSCGTTIQPFDPPYFEVPFHLEGTQIMLDVTLNGQKITAMLDSGSSRTLLSRSDARRAGVTRESMATDEQARAIGVDSNPLDTRIHRFGTLAIGAETMNNFPFAVSDFDTSLIGDDFFEHNRVWISYPRQRLFIQPAMQDPLVHQVP